MLPYLLILFPLACHAVPFSITDLQNFFRDTNLVNDDLEASSCDLLKLGTDSLDFKRKDNSPAVMLNNPPVSIFEYNLTGSYTWEQLFDINNSKKAGYYKEVKYVISLTGSYQDLKQSLEEYWKSHPSEPKLSGTFFEVFNIKVNGELNSRVKFEYESLSETNLLLQMTIPKEIKFKVRRAPEDKIYRLVFNGPGIRYKTGVLSTTKIDVADFNITFQVKQTLVLKDIQVAYTKDSNSKPENIVTDANEQDPDVNFGYAGDHIWLVPVWTKKVKEGATGMEIVAVKEDICPGHHDLSHKDGGLYRYIKMLKDPNSNKRITQVNLFRVTKIGITAQKKGWVNIAGDINQGRKMYPLSLVYIDVKID